MSRYIVKLQFYIYADSDQEARQTAENLAEEQRSHNDNECQVVSITEQPFGKLGNRAIFDVEE